MLDISLAAVTSAALSLALATVACWLGLELLAVRRRESRLKQKLQAQRTTPRTQRQRAVSTRLSDEIAQRRAVLRHTLSEQDAWWQTRALPSPEVTEWPATQPLFPDTDLMHRAAH